MFLHKLDDISVFYISPDRLNVGEVIIKDELNNILNYVNNELIEENTDLQEDAIFEMFQNGKVVINSSQWCGIKLGSNVWQIMKTLHDTVTNLPETLTIVGSLNDIIDYVYNELNS